MKTKSIELLNKAIADELSDMYVHFHCDDQGYDLLANLFNFGDNSLALQSIESSKNPAGNIKPD